MNKELVIAQYYEITREVRVRGKTLLAGERNVVRGRRPYVTIGDRLSYGVCESANNQMRDKWDIEFQNKLQNIPSAAWPSWPRHRTSARECLRCGPEGKRAHGITTIESHLNNSETANQSIINQYTTNLIQINKQLAINNKQIDKLN